MKPEDEQQILELFKTVLEMPDKERKHVSTESVDKLLFDLLVYQKGGETWEKLKKLRKIVKD